MMKTARFLLGFALVAVFLLAACSGAKVPKPANVVEQPTVVEPTPTKPAPVASPEPEPTQPQYAPFCETASIGCETPAIEMLDKAYCVKRVPYAIMAAPDGTSYESLDPDLVCIDEDHNDGRLRITCHSLSGKQIWAYDIKVCNSACAAPGLQMETGQCPENYGYNAANACCAAPAPSGSDGCTIYRVELGACYVP